MTLLETNLGSDSIPKRRGKVRDIYDLGDSLLFIATDRISAFDCILGSGIPCKGRVLTQTSLFWFDFLREFVPSHVLNASAASVVSIVPPSSASEGPSEHHG